MSCCCILILFGITLISIGVLYKKLNYDLVESKQDDLIIFGILISVGSTMTLFGFGCLILIWINLLQFENVRIDRLRQLRITQDNNGIIDRQTVNISSNHDNVRISTIDNELHQMQNRHLTNDESFEPPPPYSQVAVINR